MPFFDVSIADLLVAFAAWPGEKQDKGTLSALILRVRIERAVVCLAPSIIASPSKSSLIELRLHLSIGEPGLDTDDQIRRMSAVTRALGAYGAICDVLHGRNSDPSPPPQDVAAWTDAVDSLEAELSFVGSLAVAGSTTIVN